MALYSKIKKKEWFNTFIPQVLEIGGFTTGLFKTGTSTLVGLFILCSGATINFKQAAFPFTREQC